MDLERTMYGLGKPLKKPNPKKIEKNSKNQSEIAACEQNTTSKKTNIGSFSLHFLFRCDENHYSNLTSKNTKMCEQILKKQRPNTIQIL